MVLICNASNLPTTVGAFLMPGSTTMFELCTKKWAEGPGMFEDFAHGIVVTERRWYEEKRHTFPYITWKVRAAPRRGWLASTRRRAPRAATRVAPQLPLSCPSAAPQLPLSCPSAAPQLPLSCSSSAPSCPSSATPPRRTSR